MASSRGSGGNGMHQPTLAGLWKRKGGGGEHSESTGVKKSRGTSHHAPSSAPLSSILQTSLHHAPLSDPSSRQHAPSIAPLFSSSPQTWENKSLHNGPMLLLRGCIGGKKSSERGSTREELNLLPEWDGNVTFKIYGKDCKMHRQICQFSTGGKMSYSYSGLKNMIAPEFPIILQGIKCQVEELICDYVLDLVKEGAKMPKNLTLCPEFIDLVHGVKSGKDEEIFNYVLCNHYRSGEEYMGYHADSEDSLDPYTPIASVSLGVTRHFDIRPRKKDSQGKRSRVARIALGDGDLLLMLPPMQSHYEHAIPVEKRVTGERINLTFRRIVTKDNK